MPASAAGKALQKAYANNLERCRHTTDDAQARVVDRLAGLLDTLAERPARRWWPWRRGWPAVKGIYIWGGVGRGKTYLLDLFYDTLPTARKRRRHFHRMMHDVHRRLGALGDVSDPVDRIAAEIAGDTRVLCFDEFFVSDIGDAMILGRLLDGLFRRGVTLVATSNLPPAELYRDGLQRQRFLPAIEALEAHCDVVELDSGVDYRLRQLERAGTYFVGDCDAGLQAFFDASASSDIRSDASVSINGRDIPVHRLAKGIGWFHFDAVCRGPRSQADYIELARWLPTFILSGVPLLTAELDNEARRFIALVDEFYDRRVKLVVSADAPIDDLYRGRRLEFEFRRTISRLTEMQSSEYLAQAHLA